MKNLAGKQVRAVPKRSSALYVKGKLCRNNASGLCSGATQRVCRGIDVWKFEVLFVDLFENDLTTLPVTATV
jgi:hypothetical protein